MIVYTVALIFYAVVAELLVGYFEHVFSLDFWDVTDDFIVLVYKRSIYVFWRYVYGLPGVVSGLPN